jgi:hypothetical protein
LNFYPRTKNNWKANPGAIYLNSRHINSEVFALESRGGAGKYQQRLTRSSINLPAEATTTSSSLYLRHRAIILIVAVRVIALIGVVTCESRRRLLRLPIRAVNQVSRRIKSSKLKKLTLINARERSHKQLWWMWLIKLLYFLFYISIIISRLASTSLLSIVNQNVKLGNHW